MDGELWFDPMLARRGATGLAHAGDTLAGGRSNHGGSLEDGGAARPWGTDSLGQAFAPNYDRIAPIVLAAWTKVGTCLADYAAGVTAVTDAAMAAEDAARQRLTW